MRTGQEKKYMRAGPGDGNHKDWTRGYWTRERKTGGLDKGKEKRGLDEGRKR